MNIHPSPSDVKAGSNFEVGCYLREVTRYPMIPFGNFHIHDCVEYYSNHEFDVYLNLK
jgi:hypothetical protein